MKINRTIMHTNSQPKRGNKGFTLIEMIGVLAVIAILAALLIPKIFQAISNARINSAAAACSAVKAAVADHYAKTGSLGTNSATFDVVLLQEGFMDKPFEVKISDVTNHVQLADGVLINVAAGATNTAYALSGTVATNDAAGAQVVEAVMRDVSEADARALSLLLDGPSMSSAIGADDLVGRVKYAHGSPTEVHVYITHR